jgi:hypothetical protein
VTEINGKIKTLVLAVWFACRSSTGSRALQPSITAQANLRCPRNGKRMNFLHREIPPHHCSHWDASEQRAWEGDEDDPPARIPANTVAVCSLSRDVRP